MAAPPSPERDCAVSTADNPGEQVQPVSADQRNRPNVLRMPVGRRLNPVERARLILEVIASYRQARRVLRRMPIRLAVQILRGGAPADATRGSEREVLAEAWRLGRAVRLTLRWLPGDTRCLTRSLVLTQMLARRGIEAKLVIGVQVDGAFSAHAWVELAGEPVLPVEEHSTGRLVEL